ncbi:hypothetical protein, partial [Bacillus subtilis]
MFCTKTGLTERDEIPHALDAPAQLGRGGLNLLFGFHRLDVPTLTRSLQVPTLLLWGGSSETISLSVRSTTRGSSRRESPLRNGTRSQKIPYSFNGTRG